MRRRRRIRRQAPRRKATLPKRARHEVSRSTKPSRRLARRPLFTRGPEAPVRVRRAAIAASARRRKIPRPAPRIVLVQDMMARQGQNIVSRPAVRPVEEPKKRKRSVCAKRRARREVLLAANKVNRSGGAPGPYKKHRNMEKC
jgi:hypothetical protein